METINNKIEMKIALLIDADNMSSKYVNFIINELTGMGVITTKRAYGDWSRTALSSWKDVMLNNGISPVQQYAYTTGKNATDIEMVIDAMDMLYLRNVDCFCLVTSDSDFTRLAQRLREAGKYVIGIGEENRSPRPFVTSCNEFKYAEVITEYDVLQEIKVENDKLNKKEIMTIGDKENSKEKLVQKTAKTDKIEIVNEITSKEKIEKYILEMLRFAENMNGVSTVLIGEVKRKLKEKYPDFDERNYGYSKMSNFLESFNSFETDSNPNKNCITKTIISEKNKIGVAVKEILKSNSKPMDVGLINKKIKEEYKQFNIKDYGYTKVTLFLNSINGIKVIGTNAELK